MVNGDRVGRERALRRAVLAGDEDAWRTWYADSFDNLYAYVCWRCGGLRDLADEVVQETWLTAVRRVRDFDPARAGFGAWLAGIAANVLRNHLRRRQRDRALFARLGPADPAGPEPEPERRELAWHVA